MSMSTITIEEYNGTFYKVLGGTWYDIRTPDSMVRLLEALRTSGTRCRFHWGDMETGQDWGEQSDIYGRIGRSMGPVKSPLLIHNSRSTGGGLLASHCIVKIAESRGKRTIYQHPHYKEPVRLTW